MGSKSATALGVLALVGLVGCGSDANTVLVPNTTQATLEQLAGEVISPALDVIDRFGLDDVLSGPQPAIVGQECSDLSEVCSAGALELCFSANGQTYDFNNCTASSGGMMLDGMIAESLSSMTFDLGVDGVAYAGTIDLSYQGSCVAEILSGFVATSAISTSTVSGTLTYCDNQIRPGGSANFAIAGTAGSWIVALTMDHSDIATAVVTDVSSQSTENCTIDFGTNQATCSGLP